jgi:hypothetical protein
MLKFPQKKKIVKYQKSNENIEFWKNILFVEMKISK